MPLNIIWEDYIWEELKAYNSSNNPLFENDKEIINSSDSDDRNDEYTYNNKNQSIFELKIDFSNRNKIL